MFIGSRYGDSQLIRLNSREFFPFLGGNIMKQTKKINLEPDENHSFVTVLETYANIGPIRDMVLLEQENGQTQLLTCSGAFKVCFSRLELSGPFVAPIFVVK